MKIKDPCRELNELAYATPQAGDFWLERIYLPYFIVVQADVLRNEYTVLSCMGGPQSFNRKDELNAKRDNHDGTWEFDYSKSMVVNKEWITKAVRYSSGTDGFVCDVTRSARNDTIVQEWVEYKAQKLMAELKKLGPMASTYILRELS
jgi:hypothetical protein